jgi:hemoglobin
MACGVRSSPPRYRGSPLVSARPGCGVSQRRRRVWQRSAVVRPSLYEFAGGQPAFLKLATAHHERCLRDPVLQHPFSHPGHPRHVERLANYRAELLGGPPRYSQSSEGQSGMLSRHAGMQADDDLGPRFVASFMGAIDDAGLPDEPEFRGALRAYMDWATAAVHAYNPKGSTVPPALPVPHWGWDGPDVGKRR